MTFTIRVTKEMIRRGIRASWEMCPIALAMQEAGFKNAVVYCDYMYPFGDSQANGVRTGLRYYLPKIAVEFIKRLDNREVVSPIVFDITFPGFLFGNRAAVVEISV